MKYLLITAIAFAGATLRGQSCDDRIMAGRLALSRTNHVLAKAHFEAAATQCPERDDARFLHAVTRVLAIPLEPAGSNFLNRLGFPADGRNIFHWDAWLPADTNRVWLAPEGVNANEAVAVIRTNILPAIAAAAADLESITDPNFLLTLTEGETTVTELTVDYGDVLLLRALLHAFKYLAYTVQSWNFDVQLSALRALHDGGMLSVQQVLANYPQLLTFTSTNELLLAKTAFQTAIDRYYQASAVIRARAHNLQRLFSYDFEMTNDEERFRCILASVRASLQSPVVLCTASNYTLHLSRHFDGQTSLRDLLPAFGGDRPVVGTWDSTFGGVVAGLSDIALEGLLGKFVPMAVVLGSGGIIPPNRFISEFRTLPNRVYALEYSSNLRNWTQISQFYSEGGTYGFVDGGTAEFRYYRLTELYTFYTLSGQVVNVCSGAPIAGASLQVGSPFFPPFPGGQQPAFQTTDLDGKFEARLARGSFSWIYVSSPGFRGTWVEFFIFDQDKEIRVALEPVVALPPPNDSFANRTPLTNFPVSVEGWICASQEEDDDPVGYGSMWWTWTAPFSGRVGLSLNVEGSVGYLAVFEGGTLAELTQRASSYSGEVHFDAVAGTTYQIAAGRFSDRAWTLRLSAPPVVTIQYPIPGQLFTAPADVSLGWAATDLDGTVTKIEIFADGDLIASFAPSNSIDQFTWANVPAGRYLMRVRATDNLGDRATAEREVHVRPANDAFVNRIPLSGSSVLARATARAATFESMEPFHGGNPPEQTIWWSWTPPSTGPATIVVKGDALQRYTGGYHPAPTVAVYTGSQLDMLTVVVSNTTLSSPQQLTFAATEGTPYAIVLAGYHDEVKLQVLPTAPPAVSIVAPTNNQVFAAPANVVVHVDASDPEGTVQAVEVSLNGKDHQVTGGQITFSNLLGGNYTLLAKVTDDWGISAISQRVSLEVRVPNDHFANRIVLTGAVVNVTGTTVLATTEYYEPYHADRYPRRTIWWSWTAPASGTITISTAGSNFDTVLAAYTGTSLGQLTSVASNDNAGDQTSRVTFPVTAGATYQIVVGSGSYGGSGTVSLSISLQ